MYCFIFIYISGTSLSGRECKLDYLHYYDNLRVQCYRNVGSTIRFYTNVKKI